MSLAMNTDLIRELNNLRFGIEKSMRYHQRRRAHYEFTHRVLMFLVVLAALAGMSEYVLHLNWWVPIFLPAAPMLFAVIDLVYSPGTQARDHLALHQRFATLVSEVLQAEADAEAVTAAKIAQWNAARVRIETDEPAIYWALEADCFNEMVYARDQKDLVVKQGLFKRLFMQWIRFDQLPSHSG